MRPEHALIISVALFFILIPVSVDSAKKLSDGEPCMFDHGCSSGECHWDYVSSNGKFCANDSETCVHLSENDTIAAQYDENETIDDYRCDDGKWSKVVNSFDTDNDGVENSIDLCPGTTHGCKVSNGMIDPSDGCPFNPYIFTTNLDETDDTTCVIGSFGVLAEPVCGSDPVLDITYVLGGIDKKTCDTSGEQFWVWMKDKFWNMCRIEDLQSPGIGTYSLYARYIYPYERYDFIGNITITSDCNPTEPCKAGWRIIDGTEELKSTLTFSSSFYIDGSEYVCCSGTSVGVNNINVLNARCADGVPTSQTPGIVGWVYHNDDYTGLSINNAYSVFGGRCIRYVEREELIGMSSKEVGYIPVTDCESSSIIGDTTSHEKTNMYILEGGGRYNLVADMVHTVCTSPSAYICPWESPARQSHLCEIGQLKNWKEGNGWLEYENYTLRVIAPSLDMSSTSPEKTYYVSDPYSPPQNNLFLWNISNNGIGDISLEDITVECPHDMDCHTTPSPQIIVDEGDNIIIQTEFSLICDYAESEFPLKLSFNVKDNYGLGCLDSTSETLIAKVIQGNLSDDSESACSCFTGTTDMWDSSNGCCDKGDCWISSDSTWICNDGERIDGNIHCEKYTACGDEWYWNKTFWHGKIPQGCPCSSSTECDGCDCVDGICMGMSDPGLSFYSDTSITVRLGETFIAPITIKNNLPVKDSIQIDFYSSPEKLSYWMEFPNSQKQIVVDLEPFAEVSVPLEIFCGEKGNFELTVNAESLLSDSLHAEAKKGINIVGLESGLLSRSPGITSLAFLATVLISAVILFKKRNRKR